MIQVSVWITDEARVYSARYSESGTNEDNNKKLIEDLKNIEDRRIEFVCVISLAKRPSGEHYSFRGEIEGKIIDEARGKDGFGYDPYFCRRIF